MERLFERIFEFIFEWVEISYMAIVCLWQEIRGEEPDCPVCWKCEMMRVIVLCVGAFIATKLVVGIL